MEVILKNIDVSRGERRVLHGVDWHIRPGQRWVLAGANGAGKTQLLKVVAGSVWPEPGGAVRSYRWGREHRDSPFEAQDEIAYVGPERQDRYERYGWNHTVTQVVGTGIHRSDIPLDPLTAADEKRVASLLRRLGIQPLAQRRFLTLSYGERRMVLLARALASRPRLLLMDELLNGLDTARHQIVQRFLSSTTRSQLPWALSVHRLQDVPAAATHALVMDAGRVVYAGPVRRAPLRKWFGRAGSLSEAAEQSDGTVAVPGAAAQAARPRGRKKRLPPGTPLASLHDADVYLDGHHALKGLTLTIRQGECWVVHGRNGSGKSTFVRTLYGDNSVAAGGRIEREGIVPGVPLEEFKLQTGLVAPHLQADHPRELTVDEVVQSGRHASIGLNDRPTAADRAAARSALAFFGIPGFGPRPLAELSYGQLRRVLFARAWVNHPRLLLLDEPYSGVDSPTRHALMRLVDELIAHGTTVVIATHNREEWPAAATHELELVKGEARWCGPVRAGRAVRETKTARAQTPLASQQRGRPGQARVVRRAGRRASQPVRKQAGN